MTAQKPFNLKDLETFTEDEWSKIPADTSSPCPANVISTGQYNDVTLILKDTHTHTADDFCFVRMLKCLHFLKVHGG